MRAIYAFSGDPITYGHIDIVRRAARTYDEVVVAIGENPEKTNRYLFPRDERLEMTERALGEIENVTCALMDGLLAEYSYRHGFDVIIRGVRNNTDLEGELVLFAANQMLHQSVDTVFFPTKPELSHISSSVVKAIVAEGGDVSRYCPLFVKERLERRLLGKVFIGVAGGIAAGKTLFAQCLIKELQKTVVASYISLDSVGHFVLSDSPKAIYRKTRERICREFGDELMLDDGSIDRKALGKIVFNDSRTLKLLNRIMREPMLARLYEETRATPEGITVLEGAILVEGNWSRIVNNRVILVDADEETRLNRLLKRNRLSKQEAEVKIKRQMDAQDRRSMLQRTIRRDGWGHCWEFRNTEPKIDCSGLAREILDIWKDD